VGQRPRHGEFRITLMMASSIEMLERVFDVTRG
jgi:hypothetical protein